MNYLVKKLTVYQLVADEFASGSAWWTKPGTQDEYATGVEPGETYSFGPYSDDAILRVDLASGNVEFSQLNLSNPVPVAFSGGGTEGVSSVNGKTGDVELSAEDVGALPDDYSLSAATDTTLGGVLQGAAVADATDVETDLLTQFNALLASLRAAGVISTD